jgi:O-methyltransferase involved in polyketide biosynthesis
VNCPAAATKTTVSIAYAVTGAVSQQIIIDGLAEPALSAATGTVSEPVHCDGLAHSAALVAVDAHGARTSQVKNFTTKAGASG